MKTLIYFLSTLAVGAAMPDFPAGIETKCNTVLDGVMTSLVTVQTDYAGAHNGRYWQGIKSPASTPKDGNKAATDTTRKPTDQKENWADAKVALPATSEVAVSVDVYDGPRGKGYVVIGEIDLGGKLWRRSINVGPEKERESDWQEMKSLGAL